MKQPDPRVVRHLADYLQNVQALAGNDEFVERLATILPEPAIHHLCQMTVDELLQHYIEWMQAEAASLRQIT